MVEKNVEHPVEQEIPPFLVREGEPKKEGEKVVEVAVQTAEDVGANDAPVTVH